MNNNLELKLQAWLDGELSDSEARRFDREMAGDAEASQLVAELRSVKNALAGNETPLAVPETREFYWSKIERQIQREAQSPRVQAPSQPAWCRWLAPFAGYAALACMLLLAVKPFAPPTFDELSSTGEGMEAVTFHDQSTGMTVVWLADTTQPQPVESPDASAPDKGEADVEMD
jgi:anti-sigma-K factor RskA